jgi:hypothetical protein
MPYRLNRFTTQQRRQTIEGLAERFFHVRNASDLALAEKTLGPRLVHCGIEEVELKR